MPAISNLFFGFVEYLISNYAPYFPVILFFFLLFVKLAVYSAARMDLRKPMEQIGIDFCLIGFAFFSKAIFDQNSQLHRYFSSKDSLGPAILMITLIFVLIFIMAVVSFQRSQTRSTIAQYGYLGANFVLGFLMVFMGTRLI